MLSALLFGTGTPIAEPLLNAEAVQTEAITWVAFREPFDRRVELEMLAIGA